MTELYLAIAVLCFLVAIVIYCFNKSVQNLKELYRFWEEYKKTQVDFEETLKNFYKDKK